MLPQSNGVAVWKSFLGNSLTLQCVRRRVIIGASPGEPVHDNNS